MHPKRWNVLTWCLLLLWTTSFCLQNSPLEPSLPEKRTPYQLPDGTTVALANNHAFYIGYPFTYLKIKMGHDVPTTHNYNSILCVANCALGICTLMGIVFVVQTLIPRFSIRTALLATALVAGVVCLGRQLLVSREFDLFFVFVHVVFFFPLAAVLPTMALEVFRRKSAG